MEIRSDYRQDGYQKGFIEGKRTGGKVNKKYVDNFLKDETQSLSTENSSEFIEGWYEGFTDAVRRELNMMVKQEGLVKNQKYDFG
jgi:hypothetical protein